MDRMLPRSAWVGLALVLGLALLSGLGSIVAQDGGGQRAAHAQSGEVEAGWEGSRFRCAVCHTHHGHEVVMPHPLRPDCNTCHSGTPTRVGCPTCHSMHTVDYPHETYTTCNECHAGEEIAAPAVRTTGMAYLSYLFNNRVPFLSDDSALD